ncbi:transposase, IS4 family [Ancylostoma ceylanicum]|uniref:Transposase, IS4 family n=3 Tax=Ancylostoma ceylanicum TaxID=53326 RepID=A0A0D6LQ19_9BILA|nr:transposase, IS4 family [Ancylostoma ceylanicum]
MLKLAGGIAPGLLGIGVTITALKASHFPGLPQSKTFAVKQCHNNDITPPCAMEGRAFSVGNDEREENELLMRAAAPRLFLPRRDSMEMLSDERFREQLRLTTRGLAFVLSLLEDDLQSSTRRSAALTPAQKLSISMNFFDSASIQRKTYGYSQATVSRVIAEVSDVLYSWREEFIHWPDEDRLAETRMAGIPEVVGAMDGTHIKIIAPVVDEDSYVNREDYHSLNLSIISDANQRIIWASAKYPGRVFKESRIYREFQQREKTRIILGDSAYGAKSFPLKPILRANRTPAEDRYTNAVCAGRAVVERAIGALKRQFFMLHLELRYEPEHCAKIRSSSLRAVPSATSEPEFEFQRSVEEEVDDFFIQDNEAPRDSAAGAAMRQHIIDTTIEILLVSVQFQAHSAQFQLRSLEFDPTPLDVNASPLHVDLQNLPSQIRHANFLVIEERSSVHEHGHRLLGPPAI